MASSIVSLLISTFVTKPRRRASYRLKRRRRKGLNWLRLCNIEMRAHVENGSEAEAQSEPMMSASHPMATEQRTQFNIGSVPVGDIAHLV